MMVISDLVMVRILVEDANEGKKVEAAEIPGVILKVCSTIIEDANSNG